MSHSRGGGGGGGGSRSGIQPAKRDVFLGQLPTPPIIQSVCGTPGWKGRRVV